MNRCDGIQIVPAESSECAEAIRCLMRSNSIDLEIDDRKPFQGRADVDGLFVAKRDSSMVAAVWAISCDNGLFVICLPPSSTPERVARQLLQHIDQYLHERSFQFARVNLPEGDTERALLLTEYGFRRATTINSLYWSTIQPTVSSSKCDWGIKWEAASCVLDPRLISITERTYQGSLDCPEFTTSLSARDVLAAYQVDSVSFNSMPFIVVSEQADVGCVILQHSDEEERIELAYMGIIPDCRRRGIGGVLLRQIQIMSIERKCRIVTTAVDAKNRPASRLYHQAGFLPYDSSVLYVKQA